jgi:hypothetical protein
VNCRNTQDRISPYIDGRLTGEQMLEVQGHIENCRSCRNEFMIAREAKLLLRALPQRSAHVTLERCIQISVSYDQSRSAGYAYSHSSSNAPPRGRRLATALAMSCLTIFVVAAPFGSGTVNLMRAGRLGLSNWPRLDHKNDLLDSRAVLASIQPQSSRDAFAVSNRHSGWSHYRQSASRDPQDILAFNSPATGSMSYPFSTGLGSFANYDRQ